MKNPGIVDQTIPGFPMKRERLENEKVKQVFYFDIIISNNFQNAINKLLNKYEAGKKCAIKLVQYAQLASGKEREFKMQKPVAKYGNVRYNTVGVQLKRS